jgi:hypothetical protein
MVTRRTRRSLAGLPGILFVLAAAPTALAQDPMTRASVNTIGVEGNADSGQFPVAISSDGRWVAFDSIANGLVKNDKNNRSDIFVRDLVNATTVRVSVDSAGVEGDGDSYRPALSTDGRFVAFESLSDNLVANDTNSNYDVFLHDRDPDANGVFDEGNGVTIRVSVSSSGTQGDAGSFSAAISGDAAFIAFASDATNLVSGVDRNNSTDIFLYERATAKTSRLSLDSTGTKAGNDDSFAPTISADGAFIAFESAATNLVVSDTNGVNDVFVRDRVAKVTTRVSVSSAGTPGDGNSHGPAPLSKDGAIVAFHSGAKNLVANDTNNFSDVFVRDRTAGVTTRVSVDSAGNEGNGGSFAAALSSDGQVVAFHGVASNLVAGDKNGLFDVFVHDRATGTTTDGSFNCGGAPGDGPSQFAALSGDGLLVAFASTATILVPGDTNGASDVFVHDRTVVPPTASWSNYDVGFPGTNGVVPTLTSSAPPALGTTISLDIGNSSGTFAVGFLLIGASKASTPTKDGGTMLVDFTLIVPLAIWPGGLSLPADVPGDPALCGESAFAQVIEVDPGAQFGLSFSAGLELALGHP